MVTSQLLARWPQVEVGGEAPVVTPDEARSVCPSRPTRGDSDSIQPPPAMCFDCICNQGVGLRGDFNEKPMVRQEAGFVGCLDKWQISVPWSDARSSNP